MTTQLPGIPQTGTAPTQRAGAAPDAAPTDPAELRREIDESRAGLEETVEALAAKADLKARAKDSVGEARTRAKEAVHGVKARAGDATAQVRDAVGDAADRATVATREAVADARTEAAQVSHKVHGAVDTLAYKAGRSREKVAGAVGPRWRALAVAAVALLGISLLVARRRRRS
jgi:hypothetical protein